MRSGVTDGVGGAVNLNTCWPSITPCLVLISTPSTSSSSLITSTSSLAMARTSYGRLTTTCAGESAVDRGGVRSGRNEITRLALRH